MKLALLVVLLLPLTGEAASRITSVAEPPRVDGRLDDDAWRDALRIDTFRPLDGAEASDLPATVAKLVRTDEAIYIGFRCDEPNMDRLRTRVEAPDGPTWQDDCIELFFDPSGQGNGYAQVTINAAGVVRDAWRNATGKEDLDWSSHATVAARQGEAGWTVEVRLPFDHLRLIGADRTWRFQLARTRPAVSQHLTMLRANLLSYHRPEHFERLEGFDFSDRPVRVQQATLGEGRVGVNVAELTLANRSDVAQSATVLVTTESGEAARRTVRLEANETARFRLPWTLDVHERGRVRLNVSCDGRFAGGLDASVNPPAVLGTPTTQAIVCDAGDTATVLVPIRLAEGSRDTARLHWRLLDAAAVAKEQGVAQVNEAGAEVPLRPTESGRHELRLTLRWDDGQRVRAAAWLYLVDSPFP